MTRSIVATLGVLASFAAIAQNRPDVPSQVLLGWPSIIDQDTFLKKFCLYESRIYSKDSYICVGTNQALMCIPGDPASWSLNATASWCK